jgi:hypothetical protein
MKTTNNNPTAMEGFRPTREWLPWRYIANPNVINRVTCRHRRNQRCTCGQPAQPPQQHQEQTTPEKQQQSAGPTVALAEVEHYLNLLWNAVTEAVRRFPDANQALNEVLARYSRQYPGPFGRPHPPPHLVGT